MNFNEQIGNIIFDGYCQGGGHGNPRERIGNNPPLPFKEAKRKYSFLLGHIKQSVVMVDYDEPAAFECRLKIARELNQHCIVIGSQKRGGHFYWFNRNQSIKVSNNGNRTVLTFKPVDYKCGIKYIKRTNETKAANLCGCLSLDDGNLRDVIYCNIDDGNLLDEIPFYDLPLNSDFDFFGMVEGSRQDSYFNYMIPMKKAGFTYDQYIEVTEIIQKYIIAEPLEPNEFENATRPDAWEGVNANSERFGDGGTFQHNAFARYLMEKYHIINISGQLSVYKDGVYLPGYAAIEKVMIDEIDSLRKRQRSEVLDYLQVVCERIEPKDFNRIAFNNGIYNITTNTLEPYTADSWRHIITNKIPHNYNPDAKSDFIDKFLFQLACGDEDVVYLLEEAAGACMYRSNSLGCGKMVILKGETRNGKSTFIKLIRAMLGEANISTIDLKDFGTRFKNADLYGKLANLGDDISSVYIQDTSLLKKITTGDSIDVEYKGRDPFSFIPYCTPIFSANEIPKMYDPTGAVAARMLIVPMKAYFPDDGKDTDSEIARKLTEEANVEYMIQLALDGLNSVLNSGRFTVPKKSKEEKDDYQVENNPILAFIEDCKNDKGEIEGIYREPAKDVYARYSAFCYESNFKPLSRTQFTRRINVTLGTVTKSCRTMQGVQKCFMKENE